MSQDILSKIKPSSSPRVWSLINGPNYCTIVQIFCFDRRQPPTATATASAHPDMEEVVRAVTRASCPINPIINQSASDDALFVQSLLVRVRSLINMPPSPPLSFWCSRWSSMVIIASSLAGLLSSWDLHRSDTPVERCPKNASALFLRLRLRCRVVGWR